MVKEKLDMAKLQALETENAILKQKIAEQEKLQPEMVNVLGDPLGNEMKKIRRKGKSSANKITIVEKNDHINTSLWTKDGKEIGPMHPDNAIQTLYRFADLGIMLTSDRPTASQVATYKETVEYKAKFKKETERRAIKDKSKRSGQMDRLCAEIAKMSGTTVSAINHILRPEEVKK